MRQGQPTHRGWRRVRGWGGSVADVCAEPPWYDEIGCDKHEDGVHRCWLTAEMAHDGVHKCACGAMAIEAGANWDGVLS